jgi:hypothetical protein
VAIVVNATSVGLMNVKRMAALSTEPDRQMRANRARTSNNVIEFRRHQGFLDYSPETGMRTQRERDRDVSPSLAYINDFHWQLTW